MKTPLRFVKRTVIRGVNLLPVSSRIIGTPRSCSTADDYLAKNPGIRVFPLKYREKLLLPPPVLNKPEFAAEFCTERNTKQQYIFCLPKARVWGQYGAVVTKDDVFLHDVSREFGIQNPCTDHAIVHRIKFRKPVAVDGTVAVIATAGPDTFYHWMLDILPRILMLKEAGLFDSIRYFVLNNSHHPFQVQTLEFLGIQPEKIINCYGQRHFHIEADELFVPTLPSRLNEVNTYECLLLRKYLLKPGVGCLEHRFIYLTRRKAKSRKVVNEAELIQYLQEQNVAVIELETLNLQQQMHLFHSAEMIIGPHGSGFTNIVFSKPDTVLIDLLPNTNIVSCFYTIAAQLGIRYFGFVANGLPVDNNKKNDNIQIDMDSFDLFFRSTGKCASVKQKKI